ncbi:MAG: DMT family transporter [Burkholderiaceae bacterium]
MKLPARLYALALLFSLVWTSAFIAGKFAMNSLDAESVLALRFVLTAIVLAPMLRARRWRDPRTVVNGLILGLLGYAVTLGLAFHAMARIGSSMVVIVTSCAPFITLLLAAAIGSEVLTSKRLAGVALGFIGVLLICGPRVTAHPDAGGILMACGAALAFSLSTLWARQRTADLDPQALTFWQALGAAVLLLPGVEIGRLASVPIPAWLAIAWLALAVSIGAMLLWLYLIRTTGAATAASFHLMNPVFGLILSHLIFGEPVAWLDLPGLVLVAVGIVMTTRAPAGFPAPASAQASTGSASSHSSPTIALGTESIAATTADAAAAGARVVSICTATR